MKADRALSVGVGLLLVAWAVVVMRAGRWPSGDGPHLLGTAMRLSQMLRDGDWATFAWCFQSLLGPHPPGAYLLSTIAYTILGTGRWVHLLAGGAAVWLCADGIRRCGGGLPGILLFLCCPLVWLQAENHGADLLAAAAVAQATGHLLSSDRLSRRDAALRWGLWLGLGFVTKYTAPMFLALPCLVAGWWTLRYRRWAHLLGAIGVFALVAGIWYATHAQQVAGYIAASSDANNPMLTNKTLLTGPWWAWTRAQWYPAVLLDLYGLPGVIALLSGVLLFFRGRRAPSGLWLIPLLGLVGGWLFLSSQMQRQDRYLLPALPLLAALAGSGPLRWLTTPVSLLLLYCTGYIYSSTLNPGPYRDYSHDWAKAGQSYPWVMTAFMPTSFDPDAYQLSTLIAHLRAAQGSDEGTVGMMLDEDSGAPGFGVLLSQTAGAGHRWHIATVMLMNRGGPPGGGMGGPAGGAAVFVGPFTTDAWPSREFTSLLTIFKPQDSRREAWIREQGFVLVATASLRSDLEGRVYTKAAAQ
jgi:4-amino-4-deoxy-L-arabinose transferase-like glycosyltransferase